MVVAVIVVTVGVVVSVWGGSGVVMVIMMVARGWCHGGVGCGGTAAGEEGEGKTRVRASEYDERVDRVTRINFGVRRKSLPEKFSGGGATVMAGSGGGDGGRRWLPEIKGRERERVKCDPTTATITTITMTNGDGMQRVRTLRETISPE
ncbi:hypothetical protein Tco_0206535 [Tanacetum coccineum]